MDRQWQKKPAGVTAAKVSTVQTKTSPKLLRCQVSVLLEDTEFDDGVMNGRPVQSGKFAGSLRRFLMREHLGLLKENKSKTEEAVRDPISDDFYHKVWYADTM